MVAQQLFRPIKLCVNLHLVAESVIDLKSEREALKKDLDNLFLNSVYFESKVHLQVKCLETPLLEGFGVSVIFHPKTVTFETLTFL